ncbi:putative 2-oxoglutarate oxidoreductase, delta subunit [Mucinivorans hirudinis]|uniref:Putative 2-oxoglutarate oxidoreductase, delta subunit n=1 Tax=Mucinivorans hirudinis TaxID=1433126 RepID=A0A060R5M6_9BACT|nr:putative 2-oxoglutarate oxidoreductase, delta subunit [Mucinivorans hirudinis]
MAKIKGLIEVEKEICKGCGVCVSICPTKAIDLNAKVNSKGYHYCFMVNEDACIGCAACGMVCPDSVITVFKEKII